MKEWMGGRDFAPAKFGARSGGTILARSQSVALLMTALFARTSRPPRSRTPTARPPSTSTLST